MSQITILFVTLLLATLVYSEGCSSFVCPVETSNPVYLPSKCDCSEYIECVSGKATVRKCNTDYNFDIEIEACLPKSVAICSESKLPTSNEIKSRKSNTVEPSTEKSSTKTKSFTMEVKFDIPERCFNKSHSNNTASCKNVGPDSLIPHPDDCHLFYYCVGSGYPPVCRECPAKLHFNPTLHVCDEPSHAKCNVTSTYNSGKSAIAFRKYNDDLPICVPNEVGGLVDLRPNTDDCTSFFICTEGYLHKLFCPPGQHFNPKLKVCDYPEHAGCEIPSFK